MWLLILVYILGCVVHKRWRLKVKNKGGTIMEVSAMKFELKCCSTDTKRCWNAKDIAPSVPLPPPGKLLRLWPRSLGNSKVEVIEASRFSAATGWKIKSCYYYYYYFITITTFTTVTIIIFKNYYYCHCCHAPAASAHWFIKHIP